ncbi:acyltransferase family protein [Dyadobacter endophyticus]|uniref:acyltransferase family protein n=1 Tax=Dyadobacter endophyticus TaxID=1749036 RepID=UPI003CE9CE98
MEAPSTAVQKETKQANAPGRLASIDALRGFDMLMIAGGGQFIALLGGKTGLPFIDTVAAQFEHPAWNGFTFYDFIFPLFLFLAGTSLAFSVTGGLAKRIPPSVIRNKVFKRMLILIALGILDKNAPMDIFDPAHIRYGSVLGRIGLATFISAILYMKCGTTQRLYIAAGILVAYYLTLILVPVPGFGSGDLSFEGNLVGWIDRNFMPGILKQGTYDELALLTQFPAICLTIFGTVAGDMLLGGTKAGLKLGKLFAFALAGIVIGLLWNFVFPVNKHLWSSSFIMLTSGMAFAMLALFYWIIDVKGYQKWAFFFRVIGLNSLVIYLAVRFVDFNESSRLLFAGIYKHAPENWHEVYNALGGFVLVWLFLYFLYRQKIFVKV